jgi:capsular exopolysaccharide synthesis family protein
MTTNGRNEASGASERRVRWRDVWTAVRARPLLSVGVPVVLLASTVFFLWWTAPTYEAAASLRVDEQRSGVAILEALQSLSAGGKIGTEMEELRSRSIAEEVVDSLNLHVRLRQPRKVERAVLFTALEAGRSRERSRYTLESDGSGSFRLRTGGAESRTVQVGETVVLPGLRFVLAPGAREHRRITVEVRRFDEAVRAFQRTASVARPNRDADMIRVRYEGTDRGVVQAVPDLMARRFIQRRNEVRTVEARSTAEFLGDQIGLLTAQLGATEDELRAYRETHSAISVEAQGEAQVRRLAEMQAEREMLQVDRTALAEIVRAIDVSPTTADAPSPYRALIGYPTLLRSPAASDLLRTLHELESERVPLLDRRTAADPELRLLTEQVQALDRQLQAIAVTYIDGLTAQIRGLDNALGGFAAQLQRIPDQELQLARLRRQMKVGEELYGQMQLRLKEAEIMAAVDDPSVRVVDPAAFPGRPISPDVPLTLALALFTGLLLGVGGSVLRDQMDGTVRTRDELQLLVGLPVLGAIPRIDALVEPANGARKLRRRDAAPAEGVTARFVEDLPGAPVTEAYRSLRTNINFSNPAGRPRILVVTSPAPGDGKSTTAANLAMTMTKQGLRCLLIDADLRRGQLHDLFAVRREPGLSDVLMGDSARAHAVQVSDVRPDFLATGTLPPNPAELLGSEAMAELLQALAAEYDSVVLDAPPMNLVTDAAVLARVADGVIVVARAGITPRHALVHAFDQLAGVKARVLGSVLNDADLTREKHYGAYMQSYYNAH